MPKESGENILTQVVERKLSEANKEKNTLTEKQLAILREIKKLISQMDERQIALSDEDGDTQLLRGQREQIRQELTHIIEKLELLYEESSDTVLDIEQELERVETRINSLKAIYSPILEEN